ncbi:pyridoxal phosphate-dependent decarboxylase family protein [Jannaschia sp. R86511]|uniref:pyridoxal phosphate-dependent decarboxylase family protein n=1 Tax=Jannaschia sp. R86511 TaxID=3093853 RepID=UPI0036D392C1
MPRYDDWPRLLERVRGHAEAYLMSLPARRVPSPVRRPEDLPGLGGDLPDGPSDPVEVLDALVAGAEDGITATGSGRFFGFVIGGALPAAVAADMLATTWDQNVGMRALTPAACAAEDAVERWALDLLGLPGTAVVGLVPGGMSANFTCLAAARGEVLRRAGWDLDAHGLQGAPKVHVLANADRHETVDRALRFLGLGRPVPVATDEHGRMRPEALVAALAEVPEDAPLVVSTYAGHINTGAYDPFAELVPLVRARGGWVHVDGAIGLWAGASERLKDRVAGVEAADSWATDAHKTLNVPYDCGLAVVADPQALQAAMSMHADYLITEDSSPLEPWSRTPEWSRRARGFPVWAALRSLGRSGVADLVDRLHDNALAMADGLAGIDGLEVVNQVWSTQVCARMATDEQTRALVDVVLADGRTWISGSRWHDRAVIRVSMSNWMTGPGDLEAALDVVRGAVTAVRGRPLPAGAG